MLYIHPFGVISGKFFHGQKNAKINLAIFLGGPMAAIQLVWSNGFNISGAADSVHFPYLITGIF